MKTTRERRRDSVRRTPRLMNKSGTSLRLSQAFSYHRGEPPGDLHTHPLQKRLITEHWKAITRIGNPSDVSSHEQLNETTTELQEWLKLQRTVARHTLRLAHLGASPRRPSRSRQTASCRMQFIARDGVRFRTVA